MMQPLQGMRIVVTRNEPQAHYFGKKIRALGGIPIITPLITIECTYDLAKIKTLQSYDWIVFTSANGVRCLYKALEESDSLDFIDEAKVAVVGSKTAAALQIFGRTADFIPSIYDAKTFAPEFVAAHQPTGKVLIVRGRLSGGVIQETLRKEGIPFDCLEVYATKPNTKIARRLNEMMQTEHVDVLTFMSPSTVDAWMDMMYNPDHFYEKTVICIGNTTEKRARERGFTHVYVPEIFTTEGMLTCMEQVIQKKG